MEAILDLEFLRAVCLDALVHALQLGMNRLRRKVVRHLGRRHIEKSIYFYVEGEHVAHQAIWFKTIGPLPDDQIIHNAALAYASDYSLLEPIYRRHGLVWSHPGLMVASLDHAMWFHRPARADQWLLYVQDSPNARGGRGLGLGKIFNRAGELKIGETVKISYVDQSRAGIDPNKTLFEVVSDGLDFLQLSGSSSLPS